MGPRLDISRSLAGRLAFIALLPLLVGLWGCSSKESPTEPERLEIGVVELVDGQVRWATDLPARGSVRYGSAPGEYDHVAYPNAAGRGDRAQRTQHLVRLLDLRDGESVYLQTLNTLSNGTTFVSEEKEFVSNVGPASEVLTSTMIHIGWGDAHLITMPTTGKRILMDAGETGAAGMVTDYLDQKGITELDAVIVSHIHADHIGGMVGVDRDRDGEYEVPGVLEALQPSTYVDSGPKSHSRSLYDQARDLMDEHGISRVVVERGDDEESFATFGAWDPAVRVLCLNAGLAPDVARGTESDDLNNESICLRFSYGDVDFIIGGDTEGPSESSIVDYFGAALLDVEYYKSHHHGRFDGGTEKLLRALNPRISLVPVSWKEYSGGWNDYVSSSAPQFDRLSRFQIDRFGIDDLPVLGIRQSVRNHNLTFATDGLSYEVRVEWATQSAKTLSLSLPHSDCDHPRSRVVHDHGTGVHAH